MARKILVERVLRFDERVLGGQLFCWAMLKKRGAAIGRPPLFLGVRNSYRRSKVVDLVNHQLAASNTVVELHLHYINTCRHVQFIYVVDTVYVEFTNYATVQVNQGSTCQHAVFPVVVDDQLVFGRVWCQGYVRSQVAFNDTYRANQSQSNRNTRRHVTHY